MKRDMDLVRSILRDVAESDRDLDAKALTSGTHSFEEIAYHFEIMDEAELIRANVARNASGKYVMATATFLTWKGNDFLSAVSDDGIWTQIKKKVGKTLGDVSIDTIKALAVKAGTDFLMQ